MDEQTLIDRCGGPTRLAELLNLPKKGGAQRVKNWDSRGIPAEFCPEIERVIGASVVVEEMRPDVRWERVPDATWPHPGGRPCIDVAGLAQAVAATAPHQEPAP